MGWSLDYLPQKEPELLDKLFLAVGKSLYLASAFEGKCQWVLRIVKLATHFENTNDPSSTMELAKVMKDGLLGATLKGMQVFPDFNVKDIAVLERAREARNYIAHESTKVGSLSSASRNFIEERLERLREELEVLVVGDNLVSAWLYEINEKEAAPRGIQNNYRNWAFNWVFGHDAGT